MQVLKFHSPVIENIKALNRYEFDVMSIGGGGMIYEFEVKISRSDFLKPKEKKKQQTYLSNTRDLNGRAWDGNIYVSIPNYFSYACPSGLIQPHELSQSIGLYYINSDCSIECVREPKRIHSVLFDMKKIEKKILRYYSERTFLGVCRMSYENRISKEVYAKAEKERDETQQKFIDYYKNKKSLYPQSFYND